MDRVAARVGWGTASGFRARTLTPDREPVKGVERSDHGYAQVRHGEAEQGTCCELGRGQLEPPADGGRACSVKRFAQQVATARVLPHSVNVRAVASNAIP